MRGSVLSLFAVCLAVAVCELLLPDEESAGSKRMLRMLASLCIIVILLAPIKGLLETFQGGALSPSLPQGETQTLADYEQIFLDAVERQSAKDLASAIKALLCETYGVRAEGVEVLVYLSPAGEPDRVCVYL